MSSYILISHMHWTLCTHCVPLNKASPHRMNLCPVRAQLPCDVTQRVPVTWATWKSRSGWCWRGKWTHICWSGREIHALRKNSVDWEGLLFLMGKSSEKGIEVGPDCREAATPVKGILSMHSGFHPWVSGCRWAQPSGLGMTCWGACWLPGNRRPILSSWELPHK